MLFQYCYIKSVKSKSNIPSVKIVYYCILQVHSIYHNASCVVTKLTSFICCKERLVTTVLSFMSLHGIEITNTVASNGAIAVTNRKTFKTKLLNKNFLLGNSNSISVCLSFKSKIFFFSWIWWTKSFNVLCAVNNLESNSGRCKEIGKVCF